MSGRQLVAVVRRADLQRAGRRVVSADTVVATSNPPQPGNPVAVARRSLSAGAKAARKTGPRSQPLRSHRDLLDHLATLTQDTIRIVGQTVDKLTVPTPDQRRVLDLIGAPIALTWPQRRH